MICLIDYNDLKSLLRALVDLLGLCDFFQKILDDHSVKISDIARGDLEMIHGRDNVELQLPIRCRLEYS